MLDCYCMCLSYVIKWGEGPTFTNQPNTLSQELGTLVTAMLLWRWPLIQWEFPATVLPLSKFWHFSVFLPPPATAQLPSGLLFSKCSSLWAPSSHSCQWALHLHSSQLSFEYVCLPSGLWLVWGFRVCSSSRNTVYARSRWLVFKEPRALSSPETFFMKSHGLGRLGKDGRSWIYNIQSINIFSSVAACCVTFGVQAPNSEVLMAQA